MRLALSWALGMSQQRSCRHGLVAGATSMMDRTGVQMRVRDRDWHARWMQNKRREATGPELPPFLPESAVIRAMAVFLRAFFVFEY